ncbi:unnamed protein product [Choristocarpus tenellus]
MTRSMGSTLIHTPLRCLKGGEGPCFVVRFTAGDGKYCLTAGQDRTVRLFNPHRTDPDKLPRKKSDGGELEEALLVKTYAGPHGYEILDVAVMADNSRFVSCGEDKTAFLWDVSTGRVVRRMQGHEQRLNSCCFNGDGSVLFTASYDKTVRAWDMRSHNRSPIQTLVGCKDSATSVTVTPSGDEIVVGCVDGYVRTYDMRAARVHEDNMHAPVTHASVSNDGKCILVSCLGGVIRLLEKSSGVQLNKYTGHLHSRYRMESWLTNSDAHVISGSEDCQVYIWDIVESNVVQVLKHHNRPVCSLSYHPDEPLLLTASYDGTSVLWGP